MSNAEIVDEIIEVLSVVAVDDPNRQTKLAEDLRAIATRRGLVATRKKAETLAWSFQLSAKALEYLATRPNRGQDGRAELKAIIQRLRADARDLEAALRDERLNLF